MVVTGTATPAVLARVEPVAWVVRQRAVRTLAVRTLAVRTEVWKTVPSGAMTISPMVVIVGLTWVAMVMLKARWAMATSPMPVMLRMLAMVR
jgi:hypothetical protein